MYNIQYTFARTRLYHFQYMSKKLLHRLDLEIKTFYIVSFQKRRESFHLQFYPHAKEREILEAKLKGFLC